MKNFCTIILLLLSFSAFSQENKDLEKTPVLPVMPADLDYTAGTYLTRAGNYYLISFTSIALSAAVFSAKPETDEGIQAQKIWGYGFAALALVTQIRGHFHLKKAGRVMNHEIAVEAAKEGFGLVISF